LRLETLQTEIGPETAAESPLTVVVNGATVPAVTFSKLKIASAFADTETSIAKGSAERNKERIEIIGLSYTLTFTLSVNRCKLESIA
jgi:hypothetical protein